MQINDKKLSEIQELCFIKAHHMIQKNLVSDMELFDLIDLLIDIELEKEEKQHIEDSKIDYNDEIVTIEKIGEMDTIDISVTGNQLFFCNDILTKNSMGLVFTADAVFGLITSEELESMGQIMIKQLKNRWGDLNYYRRFVIGISRAKMKLFNLEETAQKEVFNETSTQSTTETKEKRFKKELK